MTTKTTTRTSTNHKLTKVDKLTAQAFIDLDNGKVAEALQKGNMLFSVGAFYASGSVAAKAGDRDLFMKNAHALVDIENMPDQAEELFVHYAPHCKSKKLRFDLIAIFDPSKRLAHIARVLIRAPLVVRQDLSFAQSVVDACIDTRKLKKHHPMFIFASQIVQEMRETMRLTMLKINSVKTHSK